MRHHVAVVQIGILTSMMLWFIHQNTEQATADLIAGVTVAATSQSGDRLSEYIVNGSGLNVNGPGTHSLATSTMWLSTPHTADDPWRWQSLAFTLPGRYDLSSIKVWNYNEYNLTTRGVKNMRVQVSSDGVQYTNLGDYTLNAGPASAYTPFGITLPITAADTRYVLFEIDSNWGDNSYAGLSEVQFYGTAAGPAPPTPPVLPGEWLPNMSRGHNILLQRGLQIQALSPPGVTGADFLPDHWAESNFTTIHFWANDYPTRQMPVQPGVAWGITDYDDTGTVVDDIQPSGYPYAASLVSYQFGDEQDITNPAELARLKSAMASFHVNRPNVITYTNQWNDPNLTKEELATYMREVQPDMLCFDDYPFNALPSPENPSHRRERLTGYYGCLEKYRKLGLAGNDGMGTEPIPVGIYTQTFKRDSNPHVVSESEIRLNNFSAWAFGCKFVDNFIYDGLHQADVAPILFSGNDASQPTSQFYQVAETNRQSLNLGPALVRLISTDVHMKMGRYLESGVTYTNPLPSDISAWSSGAIPYVTGLTVANPGSKNNGLTGDVIVGTFKPLDASFTNPGYADDTYFMIVNGLSDLTGSAAHCSQRITLYFDFGQSGIDSLLRLSRETGLVEQVDLIHGIDSYYTLILDIDGGTGDLFKFNNGGLFVVPEPGTISLLGIAFGIFAVRRLRRHPERKKG